MTSGSPGRSGRSGVGLFLVAGLVVAGINVLFQRVAASRIVVDDLGAFNALLGLAGGLGLVGLGLQVLVTSRPVIPPRLRWTAVAGAVSVGTAVAAAVPGPGWYRAAIGAALAALALAMLAGVGPRSRLLAASCWRELAVAYLAGAVARLGALTVALRIVDTQIVAALLATAASEAVVSLVAWQLADRAGERGTADGALPARELWFGVLALGGLWMLTVADTVPARSRLSPADADGYAFASTVARSSFFVAQLLVHFALPTFIRERGRSARLRHVFVVAAAGTATVAVAAAVVVVAAPGVTSRLLLGVNSTSVDDGTLRLLAVAWATIAMAPLLAFFHVGRHRRLSLLPAVGALAILIVGSRVTSPVSLAAVAAVVAVACVLAMAVPAAHRLAPVTRAIPWTAGVHPDRPPADVSIVVPFFNPGGEVVVGTVRRLAAALERSARSYRIVAVSDGSTDGSDRALRDAGLAHVEVVSLPGNRGKGAALREGFARCDGGLIGCIDADGDLPPEQIDRFLDAASSSGADAVIGSKLHPGSQLAVERHRHLLSAVFRSIVRILFRLDVRDTQTGIKVYRGSVITALAPVLREDGFAIDVEILVAAGRSARLSIVEVPVQIARGSSTTMSPRRALSTVAGLLRIFWRDHVALAYDPTAGSVDAEKIAA